MDDKGSLRQRAISALQRSIGGTRISEPPRDRANAAHVTRVEAAIASLPPITREVFILHRFDDLGYERIARRLEISVEEVTTHMAAAILQLDRALRDMT
jgi:RNA polymerase sigma factor (sigma-70 family)